MTIRLNLIAAALLGAATALAATAADAAAAFGWIVLQNFFAP